MSIDRGVAKRFVVHGRVQGVGYRYAATRAARRFAVVGWVRNRSDGTVEVLAEGSAISIAELAAWLESGPPGARVSRVEAQSVHKSGTFADFRVEY